MVSVQSNALVFIHVLYILYEE